MSKAGTYSNQGDDYQRAVAINWIIKLITDNTIEYVQVESNGLTGKNERVTVDDIVVVYKDDTRRHIQVKKNQPLERPWSIKDWGSELPKILSQLEQGEHVTVELYSATSLGDIKALSNASRLYPNFCDFKRELSKQNTKALSILVKEWCRTEEEIFNLLKRLLSGSELNIEKWREFNEDSLKRNITHPLLALDVLETFVNRHQSKGLKAKFEIRAQDVFDELASKGLTRVPSLSEEEIIYQFQKTSAIGRNDWKRTIAGEKITRKELDDTLRHIRDKKSTIIVQDRPGSGKTCLLLDLADAIEKDDSFHLLFIKGDRFAKVNSDDNSLPKEIVESCGLLSSIRQVVVVIDSLDVLSCQRDHAALIFFLKLIDQLQIIKNVTVVAACREFDLKYDPKLRDRKWDAEIKLRDFDFQETVVPILNKLNVNVEKLNPDLKELLCLPQNLSLFEKVSGYKGVFEVRTTYDLYKAFIDFTLRQDSDIEEQVFEKIFSIVVKLLKNREHSLHRSVINIDEHILHSLVSKGVLNEEAEGKFGFSHQTLFDNFVASNALQNGTTLSELILEHPPLPFYRPSVRSYLFFVRGQSFKSFSKNIREALSNKEIAHHFKWLVVETYAEMIPTEDDWNLIRWIFLNQNDLFKRFFWVLKSNHWFELIAKKWYPSLSHQPENYEWFSAFLRKLDVWMNIYPNEIVEIWNNALKEEWGKSNIWSICHNLRYFKHYQIGGVKDLVYTLKENKNTDLHFLGIIYCNYIEATGNGYEILWDWMTRDISLTELKSRGRENRLHLESHNLKDGEFLKKHLNNSEEFLNLVLKTLLEWVEGSYYWKEDGLTYKLLEYTSTHDNISRMGSIYIKNIPILIKAVEEAILNHARINSVWWRKEEVKFRKCKELAFRYVLIKAYLENVETNLNGIVSQLLDKELFETGELNYELGLLINQTFYLLPEQTQDEIISVIENLYSGRTDQDEHYKYWQNRVRFELFIRIPACYRSSSVVNYINKFIPKYGYYLPGRKIYSNGGWVRSPVSSENIDNLSPEALYKLFSYYKDYRGHSFHPADGNSGGLEELSSTISTLAKNNPAKYLRIVNNPLFDEFSDSITKPILEGVSSHIHCRMGKVSDSSYNPISPLPDINEIGSCLLDTIEIKHSSFENDITYARMLEYCIDALSTQEDLERVVKLLMPLSTHPDPDGKKLNIQRLNENKVTADDIANNSINCTRGVVANSAIEILNKLLDLGINPFESVISLIMQLATDIALEVKAALLPDLAYTAYKDRTLGWQIFDIIFSKKQTHLWVLAERFLYHQYFENFVEVKPFLDRIKNEALHEAGATWGRLSALCMVQGHINRGEFFVELRQIGKKEVWDGALSVFIANLEKNTHGICQESFREFIKGNHFEKEFGYDIDQAFRLNENGKNINEETGYLFIDSLTLDEDKSHHLNFFIDWIEYQAEKDPIVALGICENLISKLESFESKPSLWHSKPLISALTTILREADEMDDMELINRAVRLQDQFLLMGIDGMEEYFVEAAMI